MIRKRMPASTRRGTDASDERHFAALAAEGARACELSSAEVVIDDCPRPTRREKPHAVEQAAPIRRDIRASQRLSSRTPRISNPGRSGTHVSRHQQLAARQGYAGPG